MKINLYKTLNICLLAILILNITCQKLDPVSVTKFSKEIPVATPASPTTASVTGKFMAVGDDVISYGHCWSTSPNPSETNFKTANTGKPTKHVEFTSQLTGLAPATKYYVKAYAITSDKTIYSSEISFTSLAPPVTITTATVSAITYFTATIGGTITADAGTIIIARGFCWDIAPAPTVDLATKTSNGTGTGTFISNITGLAANTKYYIRAYATSSFGTIYGNEISFTTSAIALPSLSTTPITAITQNTATSGGNITDDGGATITARGVCYGTTSNPTILNAVTIDGTGAGIFASSLTGLTANTTYYVRAYAINDAGTAYGNEVSFTTLSFPTVTDVDGNVYHEIIIGTQTWMLENLKTTKYNDGTTITNITDNAVWTTAGAAYCWYNNDISNKTIYGALYNWNAIDLTSNGNKNICPAGWHISTDAEWKILEMALGMSQTTADLTGNRGTNEGSKLAGNGALWTDGALDANTAFGESNFTALPGGKRSKIGEFSDLGYCGYWLNSTGYDDWSVWSRNLYYNYSGTSRFSNNKFDGLSIRCVKGEPIYLPTLITTAISSITQTTATSGGNITDDGGASVTARGVCWSINTNPTIALAAKTVNGTGTGTFVSSITGLTANTKYYVRAYATNSVGTAYGNEVSFTTSASAGTTVTDADGNVYNTVTIGTQLWMKENLKTTKYNDGTLISSWTSNNIGAYTWYNNDEATYKADYGAIYNWYAVNNNNLCPSGWHVPTNSEWNILATYLGGASIAGGKIKEIGTAHWSYPNTGATNVT